MIVTKLQISKVSWVWLYDSLVESTNAISAHHHSRFYLNFHLYKEKYGTFKTNQNVKWKNTELMSVDLDKYTL